MNNNKCPNCNSQTSKNDNFCPNCGAKVESNKEQPNKNHKSDGVNFIELKEQSNKALELIRKDIKDFASAVNPMLYIAYAVLCYLFYKNFSGLHLLFLIGFSSVFLWMIKADPNRLLRSSEYYSILGSTNLNGEHRCIYCGARGVYKHGQYKSNITYAKCTKCESYLYYF